jgi:hypothetical protein
MQLRNARLCLDCEEVHDAAHCPVCASESMAFISRWVPAPERRARPRPPEPVDPEGLETYKELLDDRRQAQWRVVRQGAMGLALFGVAGWLWQRRDSQGTPTGTRMAPQSEPTDRTTREG